MSAGSPHPSSLQDTTEGRQGRSLLIDSASCPLSPFCHYSYPRRYFSRWTHIKSCKVWNGENNFVFSQDISSTQVLCVEISTILHINTLYYTYHLIHSSCLTMQLKVKLEMHLNAGMNASLLLIVDIELIF